MPGISEQGANVSCARLRYPQQQPGDLAFYKQQRKDACWAPGNKRRRHSMPQVTTPKEECFLSTPSLSEAKWKKKKEQLSKVQTSDTQQEWGGENCSSTTRNGLNQIKMEISQDKNESRMKTGALLPLNPSSGSEHVRGMWCLSQRFYFV